MSETDAALTPAAVVRYAHEQDLSYRNVAARLLFAAHCQQRHWLWPGVRTPSLPPDMLDGVVAALAAVAPVVVGATPEPPEELAEVACARCLDDLKDGVG